MYDCIVVGAGPAGSATAYHLAKQGRTVLLLEKAVLPRYKPCSGAVSPSVAEWFDFDFTPVIDRTLRRVRYTWKLGDPVEGELKTAEPIWMVRRDRFDHYLVQQAQSLGAQLMDGTAVTAVAFKGDFWQVNTAADSFEGRYVVAADGASGPMAQWLGLPQQQVRLAGVLEVGTAEPLDDRSAINFEFGLVKNGCLWSFPKQQGYSIGVSTFRGKNLQEFRSYLEPYARSFGVDYAEGTAFTHGLNLWDGNQRLHSDRALAVGEAAAIVDPLSAEGIRPAMISGARAAAALHQALSGDANALAGYTQTMHQEWGADMQWAQRIASLFYRVPGIGYRVGIKRPTATQRLGELLTGEVRYADVANRVIKRLSGGLISG